MKINSPLLEPPSDSAATLAAIPHCHTEAEDAFNCHSVEVHEQRRGESSPFQFPEGEESLLGLLHQAAGFLGAEVGSSIVGGQDAAAGKWPWVVHLTIMDEKKTKVWYCGGTILNKQWVLTAASCWDENYEVRRSMVVIGAHALKKKAARYMGVDYVMKHYDYRAVSGGFVNDIALVRLKKTLRESEGEAVGLPSTNTVFDESSDCWITGWGNVRKDVELPIPQTLQELKIPITSDDVCKAAYPWLTSHGTLCAGNLVGGKDACDGDYGGPLMCSVGGGYVQVGIMSYSSCGSSSKPGVYTKVSKYLSFIKDNTGIAG